MGHYAQLFSIGTTGAQANSGATQTQGGNSINRYIPKHSENQIGDVVEEMS